MHRYSRYSGLPKMAYYRIFAVLVMAEKLCVIGKLSGGNHGFNFLEISSVTLSVYTFVSCATCTESP